MANILEREAEAKAQAKAETRKKARSNVKNKTKIEKLESTLEEILNEPNLDGKIKELEEEIKIAQETARPLQEKFKTVSEDKRERDEAGKAKFEEYKKSIEREMHDAEAKAEAEAKAIAEKLAFYRAFKENGKQILNIREYQLNLQKRLEAMEAEYSSITRSITDTVEANRELETQMQELYLKMKELVIKRNEIEVQLRRQNLSNEDLEKLLGERAEINEQIDEKHRRYTALDETIKMNAPDLDKQKELEKDIKDSKVKISKCNTIWSSLLKGKNWNEIQAILATGKFTAEKGTIYKIRDLSEASDEKDLSESQKKTGRQVSQRLGGTEPEKKEGTEPEKDEEAEPPIEVTSFAERHPILAKIPRLAAYMDKRQEKKRQKLQEEQADETKTETQVLDRDLAYIDRQMAKGREGEIFKSLANKGIRDTVKVDVETRRKLAKVTQAYATAKGQEYRTISGREKGQYYYELAEEAEAEARALANGDEELAKKIEEAKAKGLKEGGREPGE